LSRTRLGILLLGPPLLIGTLYALTFPSAPFDEALPARIDAAAARRVRFRANEQTVLTQACDVASVELLSRLPEGCRVIVRTPFVLAGDLSIEQLERLHSETILPVTEALWRSFFDRRPDLPVLIVALSTEENYRAAARRLDGYEPLAYSGYTQRAARRIVVNLATGEGTLAHELTHVLGLFDFPKMPEWFDEGLAALHEEAQFSEDNLRMIGLRNWRFELLADAHRRGNWPAMTSIIRTSTFRGEGESLHYAYVRCFCLFLQERGLLGHFYRKFRYGVDEDPSGLLTLCELMDVNDSAEIDAAFRAWVDTLVP
jgi:hypothetical protein